MDTKIRKEAKNEFGKDFFKLMNNSVFGKTMENVRKHRVIKLATTEKRKIKLVLEQFSENVQAIKMKKTSVKMNNSLYLGMSILDISN